MSKKLRNPYQNQIEAIDFMEGKFRGGLLLDPGLGKSLAVLRGLFKHGRIGKGVLVVAPASLVPNWYKEFQLENFAEDKYTVISYEKLVSLLKVMDTVPTVKKWCRNFNALVVDESHYIKNPTAKRTKAIMRVSNYIRNVWFLTGTPVIKSSSDMFVTLSICEPGIWGKYIEFCKDYCEKKYNPWNGKMEYTGFKNSPELKEYMSRTCIRQKKSVIEKDLPEKRESIFWVDENVEPCEMDIESVWHERNGEHVSNLRKEAAYLKLGKYVDGLHKRGIRSGIVFCWHKEIAERLSQELGAALITGDVPRKKRYDVIEMFQNENIDWLVITISAGGVGLNIQRAGYVGLFELPWTAAEIEQALSRSIRIGNTNKSVLVESVILEKSIDVPMLEIVQTRKYESSRLLESEENE